MYYHHNIDIDILFCAKKNIATVIFGEKLKDCVTSTSTMNLFTLNRRNNTEAAAATAVSCCKFYVLYERLYRWYPLYLTSHHIIVINSPSFIIYFYNSARPLESNDHLVPNYPTIVLHYQPSDYYYNLPPKSRHRNHHQYRPHKNQHSSSSNSSCY